MTHGFSTMFTRGEGVGRERREGEAYLHVSDGGKVLAAARSSLVVELADPPPLLLVDILDMWLDVALLLEPLAAQGAGEGPLVVVGPLVRLWSKLLRDMLSGKRFVSRRRGHVCIAWHGNGMV